MEDHTYKNIRKAQIGVFEFLRERERIIKRERGRKREHEDECIETEVVLAGFGEKGEMIKTPCMKLSKR